MRGLVLVALFLIVTFLFSYVNEILTWIRSYAINQTIFSRFGSALANIKKLKKEGIRTEAQIINPTNIEYTNNTVLTYQFTDTEGTLYKNMLFIQRDIPNFFGEGALALKEINPDVIANAGNILKIVYDPTNPSRNYPELGIEDLLNRPWFGKTNFKAATQGDLYPLLAAIVFALLLFGTAYLSK